MRTFVTIGILALTISGCSRKSQGSCVANLRMIDGAKVMLASDQKLTNGMTVTKEQLMLYLRPERGEYSVGKIGESPKCSYPAHSHYEEPRD